MVRQPCSHPGEVGIGQGGLSLADTPLPTSVPFSVKWGLIAAALEAVLSVEPRDVLSTGGPGWRGALILFPSAPPPDPAWEAALQACVMGPERIAGGRVLGTALAHIS